MKKLTVLIVVTLMVFVASCGNKKSDSKTVTLKDSDTGAEITASVGQKKLPDDFPDDIFVIDGTISNIVTTDVGGKQMVSVYLAVDMPPKEVRETILKNMKANGWNVDMDVNTQQYYSKDKKALRIGLGKDDDKTNVIYMATY